MERMNRDDFRSPEGPERDGGWGGTGSGDAIRRVPAELYNRERLRTADLMNLPG